MFRGFLFLFFLLSNSLFSKENNSLFTTDSWENLLHYRFHLTGYKSEADDPKFFFSSDGKKNLDKEGAATLAAFATPWEKYKDQLDQHPICRFPARFLFISKAHGEYQKAKDTLSHCQEYQRFVQKINAKSISLVFSSYYLDTPASAFGHTLIRFNKFAVDEIAPGGSELLDYATNYSANITSSNAFVYALMGIVGGFNGEFANMPYFYKVREYNDFESRDLWDYQLNLSPEEIEMVLAHLWEMKQTYFNYFYLTENCSYHMMGLLDVANPNWKLTKRTGYFAIPIDTVRVLTATPGLVKNITYRPSKKRSLETRLANLDQEEKKILKQFIKNYNIDTLSNQNREQKAKILDTGIDHIDFFKAKDILLERSEASAIKQKMLIARGQTGIVGKNLEIKTPQFAPHEGHGTRRVALAENYFSKSGFATSLEYRFSLHDLLDPSMGQNPNAAMEMGRFKFLYFNKNHTRSDRSQFRIEEFDLVNVASLNPLGEFFSGTSFKAAIGGRQIKDNGCANCFAGSGRVSAGVALRPIPTLLIANYLGSEVTASNRLSKYLARLGMGPEIEVIWDSGRYLKLSLQGLYHQTALERLNTKYWYQYGGQLTIIPTPTTPLAYIRAEWVRHENETQSSLILFNTF